MSITEAMVFEYLKEKAKEHNASCISISTSLHDSPYVVVHSHGGDCAIATTIVEAVGKLPTNSYKATDFLEKAARLEKEAKDLREHAKKLLGE